MVDAMNEPLRIGLVLAYSYLLGSVPMAYVIGRVIKGIDLRVVGSGTVGASNVWYNVGKFWIFPLGIFDLFVKGLTPAFVARWWELDLEVQVAAGLLAIVGHNWPLFLGFRGGRGVAPTVGVLIALARIELALFIIVGTAGWQLTKNAAVWVLIAFATLPIAAALWGREPAIVGFLAGVFAITVAKRLVSNSLRGSGVPLRSLLWNRFWFDRDIADNEAWVRRTASPREHGGR